MPDNEVVQPGTPSTQTPTGEVSTNGQIPPASQPSPDPLAEIAKAKEELAQQAKEIEAAKRAMQSAKDRAVQEVEQATRRARAAEVALSAIKSKVKQVDPDTAKDIEIEELRSQTTARRISEQEEKARKEQEEFHKEVIESLEDVLKDMGIDPKDPQLDWADDAKNYTEFNRRVLKSAAKIKKENDKKLMDESKQTVAELVKAEIAKARKDLGLDSVDTSLGAGAPDTSELALVKKMASGDPLTKDEWVRAKKIGLG